MKKNETENNHLVAVMAIGFDSKKVAHFLKFNIQFVSFQSQTTATTTTTTTTTTTEQQNKNNRITTQFSELRDC
jgi:hypothetical protein